MSRKKRWGDRKEGRRLRSLDPFYTFTPFIMKERNDASNYFSESLELTVPEQYIRDKRAAGFKSFGMLHLFIAAYVRTMSQRPGLNRFVSGQRIYARNNIEVVMTIKKKLTTEAGETSFKVIFQPGDTADDVYARINAAVDAIKADDGENSTEKVAAAFSHLPRPVFRIALRFIGWLDYHGWVPQSLLDASPFHGSLVVTDLGSLGIGPVYHHLYNFGNVPLFLAFGAKRHAYESDKTGAVSLHKYIDFTVVGDERICDGHYYSTGLKFWKYYMKNPYELDAPPKEIVEDVD